MKPKVGDLVLVVNSDWEDPATFNEYYTKSRAKYIGNIYKVTEDKENTKYVRLDTPNHHLFWISNLEIIYEN